MLRYARRCIKRPARDSSLAVVLGWSMHCPRPAAQITSFQGATLMRVGPEKVESVGEIQSTWNLYSLIVPPLELCGKRKKLGRPAGGGVWPARAVGRPPPLVLLKYTKRELGLPFS